MVSLVSNSGGLCVTAAKKIEDTDAAIQATGDKLKGLLEIANQLKAAEERLERETLSKDIAELEGDQKAKALKRQEEVLAHWQSCQHQIQETTQSINQSGQEQADILNQAKEVRKRAATDDSIEEDKSEEGRQRHVDQGDPKEAPRPW